MSRETASVKVVCRFRPVNQNELNQNSTDTSNDIKLEFTEKTVTTISPQYREPQVYTFDRVYHNTATTQKQIYEEAISDTVVSLLQGYNGTIFAYGQTGSGKTFTMFGPEILQPDRKGIIPRACAHIFECINNDTEDIEFTFKCSFLEIYKEIIRDLLNPKKNNLKVRETPQKGVWVEDLTEEYITTEQEIYDLLKLGEKYRAVASTNMNAVSSRSHSLFQLTIQQRLKDGSTKQGRLNLADLAGSEKISKTGAVGDTLEEAKKINQSLLSLGNCINALSKGKGTFVPYRDSKLTHILKESLGGNSKTTLVIACSPHKYNIEETINTLKFGQRAKTIKNAVTVNRQRSVAELTAIVLKLTSELEILKKYVSFLENQLGPSVTQLKQKFQEMLKSNDYEPNSDTVSNSLHIVEQQLEMEKVKEHELIMKSDMEELQQLAEEKQKAIEELKNELAQSHTIQAEMNQKMNQIITHSGKLEYELKEASLQIQNYKIAGETENLIRSELESELQTIKTQLLSKQQELEDVISNNEQSDRGNRTKLAQYDHLENRTKELTENVNKYSSEISSLKKKLLNEEQTNFDLKAQLAQLEAEIRSLQQGYEQASKEKSIQSQENQNLAKLLDDIRSKGSRDRASTGTLTNDLLPSGSGDDLDTSKVQLDYYKDEHSKFQKEVASLHAEMERLRRENGQMKEKNDLKLKQEMEKNLSLNSRLDSVTAEYEDLKQRSSTSEEEKSRLEIELLLERKEKKDLETKYNDIYSKYKLASKTYQESEEAVSKLKKELFSVQSTNTIQVKEIEYKNQRIEEQEKEIEELIQKNLSFLRQIDELTRTIKESDTQHKLEIEYLEEVDRRQKQINKKLIKPVQPGLSTSLKSLFSSPRNINKRLSTIIDKEGWLTKQGGVVKNWQKRWFVLQGDSLCYYKDKETLDSKGVIPLEDCVIQEAEDETKKPFSFAIIHQSKRNYFLYASSEEEMQEWVDLLNHRIVELARQKEIHTRSNTLSPSSASRRGSMIINNQ